MTNASPTPTRRTPIDYDAWKRTALTLVAACVGAGIMWAIGAPMPFLIGAVVGAAVGGFAFAADINSTGRSIGLTFLGLQIGAGFTPEAVDRLTHAPVAAAGLVVSTLGAFIGAYAVYRIVAKWNRETALLGAMPGALATVLALLADPRADASRVAIAQSIRLGVLIVLFPLFIPPTDTAPAAEIWSWTATLPVLALASSAGWTLERLRIPAGALLGPITVSIIATLGGWVEGVPPPLLFLTGSVIIGASTGARLSRGSAASWRASAPASLLALAAAMVFAFGSAWAISPFSSLSLPTLLLAFAPGGIEAMVLLAAGLGLDPAFVAACHITRVIGLTLALPLFYRRFTVYRPN